jgi:LysM domain
MTNPPVHVVRPGESFWAIAEHHVLADNPQADDHEIARYWEVLQAQNVQRLPAPGVPDLLFPGTELSLPPITG